MNDKEIEQLKQDLDKLGIEQPSLEELMMLDKMPEAIQQMLRYEAMMQELSFEEFVGYALAFVAEHSSGNWTAEESAKLCATGIQMHNDWVEGNYNDMSIFTR